MKALLDTNILIDIFGKRPFDEDAIEKVRIMLAFGDVELWASANSFTKAFYILSKSNDSSVVQDAFVDSAEWLHACSITHEDIIAAARCKWRDFEDCLIDVAAQKVKADYIITRDKVRFAQSKTPAGSASDFVSYVRDTLGLEYDIA